MVRSNELGCRNGWNADLWVPSATDDGVDQRAQPHDPIGGRAKSEVEPSQQNDLITSIVAAKTDNLALPPERPQPSPQAYAVIEEDIFVKQTPSLSWSTGPVSSQPASELVQNPKAAILRARDQFRERRRNEGRLADRVIAPHPAPLLASSREAGLVDEFDLAEPDPAPESVDPRYENRPLLRTTSPEPYDHRRPVAPVKLREIDRPFPSMTDFPEDRARFESVPVDAGAIYEADSIEDDVDDTWIETRQIDTVPPEPYEVDEFFEEDEIVAYAEAEHYEEEELSVRHRESTLNRYFRQRRERRERDLPASAHPFEEPIEEPAVGLAADTWGLQDARQPELSNGMAQRPEPAPAPDDRPILPLYQDDVPIPARVSASERGEREYQAVATRQRAASQRPIQAIAEYEDDFALPPPLPEVQPVVPPEQSATSRNRARIEQTAPVRRPDSHREATERPAPDEFGDQPLFASSPPPPAEDYEIASPNGAQLAQSPPSFRLERICQTCRDFHPADNGERGWCNNKWAFNHRRMVDADDLGCRNSLGSWWTPKDDVWRRDGDISRHAQQTPRVDQWLFGTQSEDNERRRSGS
jgi:hypothetical protein